MLETFSRSVRLTAAAAAVALAPAAFAQGEMAMAQEGAAATESWSPTWSTSDIQMFADAMSGSWRTTEPIESTGGSEADETHVWMMIHPVAVEGMTDTIYIEGFRSDDLVTPFRQAIGQFYTRRGDTRLRTFELKVADTGVGAMAHLGSLPDVFPKLDSEDLIATLDMSLYPTSQGFTGRTPYPYPTAKGGAVEMTSNIEVTGDRLITVERGYAADGSIAWGASEEGKFEFEKADFPFAVERRDNGLIIMDIVAAEGDAVAAGDTLHVHYSGWLEDATRFDTSRQEGRDVFRFPYPPRLIQGWNEGLDGVTSGSVRKLIIPGALGYGERGQPRANIPPNATLYFTMEILLVEKPAAEADTPATEE